MTPIALLGVPNDENSSYLRGPADAPAAIRRELFSDAYAQCSESGVDLSVPGRWIDNGDVAFEAGLDPWLAIETAVARALEPGHPLISLGGDHAVTHPILRAVRRRHPRLTIVHVDAHPDLYDAYQGNPRSHASPFARIMEEGLADRLIQVGLRATSAEHRAQFRRFGVETVSAAQWTGELRLKIDTPVYLSLDLDALDPAYAPGVSHREPGGVTPRQVIGLIQGLGAPLVAADVVEYNPRCDIGNATALVAAKLVKEIAGMMAGGTREAAHLAA
ncbi:agmatinase family protein [Lysobacter enzymogenes]|uniref:agmatinase family protein n=1 Tax=Lysobacter enzymogenes TaxID=69 RepID=UPI001A977DBA|nr:agmatinase family protein [Lysobacter enzymogenes]QQP96696.1 agmatinase family protein [Lysobacter enzymogenes]